MSKAMQILEVNKTALESISTSYLNTPGELLEYYPKDQQSKIENLTQEVKNDIIKTGRRYISGIKSSIPMKCKGDKCCLSLSCALFKNSIAPIGYLCPYEEYMVDKLTMEYYTSLQVDPFNRLERDLIKQMVELIIIDNRTSSDLSENGLYMDQAVGADNKGVPIITKVESLAYSIKIKTQQRIEKIQNELVATRKIKKQLKTEDSDNPASRASNLFDRYKEYVEKENIVIDAKVTIQDKEEKVEPKEDI